MKPLNILTFMLFLMLTNVSIYAQESVDHIFKQLKNTQNYEGASVPGWVIKLGLLAISLQEDSDTKEVLNLGKKIKKIRVATTSLDTKKYNAKAIVQKFVSNITSEDGFGEYVSVKKEDSHLKILVQEDEDVIRNIVILNEDKGNISIVLLKTNLSYNDLREVSFHKLKNNIKEVNTINN